MLGTFSSSVVGGRKEALRSQYPWTMNPLKRNGDGREEKKDGEG